MSLVNASVYCTSTKLTILQWRILNSDVPDITLSQFFQERLLPLLDRRTCELQKVYVGKGKDSLVEADVNLCMSPVVSMFGAFVKFIVPQETFNDLHMLPDPVPGDDGHYVPFESVYGTATSEEHRPSLLKKQEAQEPPICCEHTACEEYQPHDSVRGVRNVEVSVCEEEAECTLET